MVYKNVFIREGILRNLLENAGKSGLETCVCGREEPSRIMPVSANG